MIEEKKEVLHMDKNALTEKRRETVIGLLKNMNIKKVADGGFDKDDVYDCMQQLCDLYEKNIEDLENAYESEIVALKDKYQKYDDNNELYVSLIMEAKKSSNDIINQAKNEVETILAEGKEEVAKQESELEQMRVGLEAEKQAMSDELNASRQAVEAEKAAMRAEVEAEKEKLSALKNKYNQQINAMEEEFNEIKTNILRTSGKIDSLKSKLPDDEAVSWDVIDAANVVDFPAEDIEVEKTFEKPEEVPAAALHTEMPAADAAVTDENMTAAEEEHSIAEEAAAYENRESEDAPGELTLEDLTGPKDSFAEEPADKPADDGVINLDSFDIELPDLSESEGGEKNAEEEISFEGLEDLFKEENK